MATKFERALIGALVAVGSLALAPANAEGTQSIALLPTNDPVLDRAFDVIRASRNAHEKQLRHNDYTPSFDSKIVRSRKDVNHVYVMGGGAAVPM